MPQLSGSKRGGDENQYGKFLVAFQRNKGKGKSGEGVKLEVDSLFGGRVLWARALPDRPPTIVFDPSGNVLLLGWPVQPPIRVTSHAYIEVTSDADRSYLGVGKSEVGYGFQIFNAQDGKMLNQLFVPGLAGVDGLYAVFMGDHDIVVTDHGDRTQVYSRETGQREGLAQGRVLAVSPDGRLVCLAETPRQFTIGRLPSLTEATAAVKFPHAISLARFSGDGQRLFVLTRDQRYYIYNLSSVEEQPGTAAGH